MNVIVKILTIRYNEKVRCVSLPTGKQGKPRGSGGKMLLRDDSPDEDGDWDLDELLEMMGDAEGTSGDVLPGGTLLM